MDILHSEYNKIFTSDKFIKLIQSKVFINSVQELIPKDNVKYFLMAFYLYGYWEEVIGNKLDPIYVASKFIVNKFKNNLQITNDDMILYIEIFNIYKENNKIIEINKILLQYFDILYTINNFKALYNIDDDEIDNFNYNVNDIDIDKKIKIIESIKYLKNNLNIVKGRLKFYNVDDENKISELKNEYETIPEILFHIQFKIQTGYEFTGDQIHVIAKQVYWDNYNMNNIYSDLTNISNLLKICIPNRFDIHEEYDNVIDIPFIKQQIDHNAFDFNQMMMYLWDKVKFLDSINGNDQIDNWLKKWQYICMYPYDQEETLPYVLRDITNKLEKIYFLLYGRFWLSSDDEYV